MEQIRAAPRKMISVSAAQGCANTFRAAHKQQDCFRAAKQNREKESDILTSRSNAFVQGQWFLKMYVRWIVFPIQIYGIFETSCRENIEFRYF